MTSNNTGRGSKLAQGIASNWVSLLINVAISFFLAPFVVRNLGSTWYGVWAVTMQFTGYLYLLDFGVRESVIRYTSKYVARQQSRQLNQILTVAFSVYGVVTLLATVLTVAVAAAAPSFLDLPPEQHTQARWVIVLVGLTITQTFIFNVFNGVLLGLQRWVWNNVIGVVITLLRTAAIVVALHKGYGIVALAAVQFATGLASGLVSWGLASRELAVEGTRMQLVKMSSRRYRALSSRVFRYGLFVFVANIGQKIIVASDAIVIAAFLPVSSVTYYAIAGSLIEPLRTLLATTAHVFAPIASRLHSLGKRDELGETMTSGSKLVLIIALPVAITLIMLGAEFVRLWMGPEFAGPAGEVLVVLGLTMIVATPSFVTSMVLYGISRHNIAAYLKIGEAVVNLSLSIVLVQSMGIVGVAIGTAIPHAIVGTLILPILTCRAIGHPLAKFYTGAFVGPLLAGAPLVLGELWIRNNVTFSGLIPFFACIAVLCVGYVLLVLVLALNKKERALVLSYVHRRRQPTPG